MSEASWGCQGGAQGGIGTRFWGRGGKDRCRWIRRRGGLLGALGGQEQVSARTAAASARVDPPLPRQLCRGEARVGKVQQSRGVRRLGWVLGEAPAKTWSRKLLTQPL